MSAVDVSYSVTGEGPPLYMVHGVGARRGAWAAVTDALKDRFTCVAFDLRGHGESPVPPVPYSLDELVEDLEALRARLGHDRIHIAGHSLGGQIGPAYARAHPDRARSVALLSAAAARTAEDSAKVKAVAAAMRAKGVKAVIETLIDRWFTDDFAAANPDKIKARIGQVLDTPEDVFLAVFDVYAATEMAPWLPQVACPCLVMTGENDGGCSPQLNRVIAGLLAQAELEILPGLKHAVLIEAPEKVSARLREFLLGQESACLNRHPGVK